MFSEVNLNLSQRHTKTKAEDPEAETQGEKSHHANRGYFLGNI